MGCSPESLRSYRNGVQRDIGWIVPESEREGVCACSGHRVQNIFLPLGDASNSRIGGSEAEQLRSIPEDAKVARYVPNRAQPEADGVLVTGRCCKCLAKASIAADRAEKGVKWGALGARIGEIGTTPDERVSSIATLSPAREIAALKAAVGEEITAEAPPRRCLGIRKIHFGDTAADGDNNAIGSLRAAPTLAVQL